MTYEFSKELLIERLVKTGSWSRSLAETVADLPVSPFIALMRRIHDFDTNPNQLSQPVKAGKFQLGRMNGSKFEAITQPQPMSAHMEWLKEIAREVGAL